MVSRIIFIRYANFLIIIEYHEFSVQFWYKNKGHRAPYNHVRNQNSARTDGILLQAGREGSLFGTILTRLLDWAVC
jgi:hypothetical protein